MLTVSESLSYLDHSKWTFFFLLVSIIIVAIVNFFFFLLEHLFFGL